MRFKVILFTLIPIIGLPARADAQQAPSSSVDVESLHDVGNALRAQNRPDAALRVFQIAFALRQEPRAQVRIALAELSMRRFVEAEEHFLQALTTPDDPWLRANHAQVETALAQAQREIGTVEVRCNVPGAELRVNDQRYRTLSYLPGPQMVRMQRGRWQLEIRAEGYAPLRWEVEVPTTEPEEVGARVTANLVRVGEHAGSSSAAAGASRTGAYVLMGLGGLALGAFAVFEVILQDTQTRYLEVCPDRVCSPGSFGEGDRQAEAARTLGTVASVTAGVGATALVAGFIWWLAARPVASVTTPRVSASIGATHGGVSLVGSF